MSQNPLLKFQVLSLATFTQVLHPKRCRSVREEIVEGSLDIPKIMTSHERVFYGLVWIFRGNALEICGESPCNKKLIKNSCSLNLHDEIVKGAQQKSLEHACIMKFERVAN